jgi:hypothetical protein
MNYNDSNISVIRDNNELKLYSPIREEITKNDIKEFLKDVYRNKPKQFPLGLYLIRYCDRCSQEFVLHKSQTFCPICHLPTELAEVEDANFKYDVLFKEWQEDKNFLENILYNNFPFEVYDDGNNEDISTIPITESEAFLREPLVEEIE